MPAPYTELFMDQGSSFSYVINLADEVTNANINAASYVVRSQMRRSHIAESATAEFDCVLTDGANGEITISLSAANTANIPSGKYFFDVEATTDGYSKLKLLEGIIIVSPEYTK